MMIHEALEKTGLTRKAVEYYIDQGLISPQAQENGYRTFSEEDVSRLERIAAYRKLGASVAQIRGILSGNEKAVLDQLLMQKTLDAQLEQKKRELLSLLADGHSLEEITPQLRALDAQESIATRLLDAFPGYFGRYLTLHFSHFLAEPIKTDDQQEAYEEIVHWLDVLPPLDLPDGLQTFLEEATKDVDAQRMQDLHDAVIAACEDPQAYLSGHEDVIRRYMAIRETEEYRSSPAARLTETMKDFQRQSGYIDVFLPAMERLSPAYAAYRARLEKADDVLMRMLESKNE